MSLCQTKIHYSKNNAFCNELQLSCTRVLFTTQTKIASKSLWKSNLQAKSITLAQDSPLRGAVG